MSDYKQFVADLTALEPRFSSFDESHLPEFTMDQVALAMADEPDLFRNIRVDFDLCVTSMRLSEKCPHGAPSHFFEAYKKQAVAICRRKVLCDVTAELLRRSEQHAAEVMTESVLA